MASPAQILANRANAQHSTGPNNTGATRYNATKHGLSGQQVVIQGEDPAEYDRHRQDLFDTCAPQNALEEMLVERIAQSWWRLQRAERIEAQLTAELGDLAIFTDDKAAKKYSLFLRHRNAIERAWRHALRELEKLQVIRAKRQAALADAQVMRDFIASREPAAPPEIGSVLYKAANAFSGGSANPDADALRS